MNSPIQRPDEDGAQEDPYATRPAAERAPESNAVDPYATRPGADSTGRRGSPGNDSRISEGAGLQFGNWVTECVLGSGAWGMVYRARHAERTTQEAAVKVPRLGTGATAREQLARFRQEIAAIRRIHREQRADHVVQCLDADPDGEPPWLALELVDGTDLHALLEQRRRFPPGEAIERALATLEGLVEAHRVGVVHRDLKPSNVLLAYTGRVLLADFGIARLARREGETIQVPEFGLTAAGRQMGSVHTMSPEACQGQQVEAAGDLYSFGCMLYHMLAGRPPFRGGALQIIHGHLLRAPAPLSDFLVDCPAELVTLVGQLLAKEAARRPTAEACRDALRAIRLELNQRRELPVQPALQVAVELEEGEEVEDELSNARYYVEREIGRGGMGVVYAVVDRDDRELALKVTGLNLKTQAEAWQLLQREAGDAMRVSQNQPHPAVARVHGVGTATVRGNPIVFLLSELIHGPSLAELVAEHGPLDDDVARDLAVKVVEGLSAIHTAGVLHLDLTPGNLLLAGELHQAKDLEAALRAAEPKIVDFGISKRTESLTVRAVEGNPHYMSPEQCGGERPTVAADLYMFGATLYHATTGRPVFSGEPMAVMHQQRTAAPRFADLEGDLGYDLALVIHKCLRKAPEDRYASAAELAEALRQIGSAGFPRSQLQLEWERERRALEREQRGASRRGLALIALLALVLVGALAALWIKVPAWTAAAELGGRVREASSASLSSSVSALSGYWSEHRDAGQIASLWGAAVARAAGMVNQLDAARERALRESGYLPLAEGAAQLSAGRDARAAEGALRVLETELRELAGALEALQRTRAVLSDAGCDTTEWPQGLAGSRVEDLRRSVQALLGLVDVGTRVSGQDFDAELPAAGTLPSFASPILEALAATRARDLAAFEAEVARLNDAVAKARKLGKGEIGEVLYGPGSLSEFLQSGSWKHQQTRRRLLSLSETLAAELESESEQSKAAREALQSTLTDLGGQEPLERVLGRTDPTREERRRLEDYAQALGEFLQRSFADQSVRTLAAGGDADALRARIKAVHSGWAKSRWDKAWEKARRTALEATSHGTFHEALELLSKELGDWETLNGRDVAWNGRTLTQRRSDGCAELLRAKRDELQTVLAGLESRLVAGDPPPGRDGPLSLVLDFAGHPEFAALRGRAQLLNAWGAALRGFLGESSRVLELPEEYRVGEGTAQGGRRLRVGCDEVTWELYELFLAVVKHLGARHRQHFGCARRGAACGHDRARRPPDQGSRHPATGVSWYDALACARWLGGRLPTGKEWEFAAHGGEPEAKRRREWDRGAPAEWKQGTLPVRTAGEQRDGIFDTAGNAQEWTSTPDEATSTYLVYGPKPKRWDQNDEWDLKLGSSLRRPPDGRFPEVGFRVVRDEENEQ